MFVSFDTTFLCRISLTIVPFVSNFREIQQSLRSAKGVHAQWAKLIDSEADPGRIENAQTELNKALKSIEWDLQDLDQTISISSLCRGNIAIIVAALGLCECF